jgi:lipoate---protein ligase
VRLLLGGTYSPAAALAHDEALVRAGPSEPALHLWSTEPAVVIGRFQRADWEVDADACAQRGVRVWRRMSGGGAVYLDGGTVCAELVVPPDHAWAQLGIPALYAPLLDGLARALGQLGVAADVDERTVRVGGRKVSGIAAHKGRTATMVHATLLVHADLEALRACLAGPRGGALEGAPRPAASRPDSVCNVERDGVAEALAAAFGARPSRLSDAERRFAGELLAARYLDPGWHAGPWAGVTPAAVATLLGPPRGGPEA